MTFMGKILVLLNLMMSVIFMAFAVVVYDTRVKLNEDLDKQKKIVNDVRREKTVAEEEKLVLDKNLKDVTEQLKKTQTAADEAAKSLKKRNEELLADLAKTRTESSKGLTELGNATTEQKQRREEVEVKNTAEALVYQTEKFLADNADKIPADARSNVDAPLDELKKAIEANDIPGMRAATDKVAQASQSLGAAMYTMAQQAGGGAGTAEGAADMSEDDVVDAEIVDDDATSAEK